MTREGAWEENYRRTRGVSTRSSPRKRGPSSEGIFRSDWIPASAGMSGWGDSLTRSNTVNLPACASFGMVGYSPPGAGTCVTDSAGANHTVRAARTKNPARFPARAQFLSFNFPNNLIWATASRIRDRESSARRGEGHAAEHLSASDRYRFIASKFSRRNWISAGLNERMRRFLHGLPHRNERRAIPAHARAQDRISSI